MSRTRDVAPERRNVLEKVHLLLAASALVVASAASRGAEFFVTPTDYRSALAKLEPGDTMTLMPGIYRDGLFFDAVHGRPDAPIVIRGTPGGPMPIFRARQLRNTIQLRNASYIVLRGLELDGLGLQADGVKAVSTSNSVHHITIDGLYIHGHGADQQIVGISAQCPAWGWIIRNNRIVGAGTGMYLGSSDGLQPFFAGVIEHNQIVNSIGYNLQIKHQKVRPAAGANDNGTGGTIIRHNVFSKAEGSSETSPRPNVLLGHWPLQGPGSSDQYFVYANLFYENPHEALLQGEGNMTLYSNAFVNSAGRAINIMPHKALPRRIDILQNTVVAKAGIRVTGAEPGFVRRIKGNAVFSDARALGADPNLVARYDDAPDYLVAPVGSIDELNLSPRPGNLNAPTRMVLPRDLPAALAGFASRYRVGRRFGAYMDPQRGLPPSLGPIAR